MLMHKSNKIFNISAPVQTPKVMMSLKIRPNLEKHYDRESKHVNKKKINSSEGYSNLLMKK